MQANHHKRTLVDCEVWTERFASGSKLAGRLLIQHGEFPTWRTHQTCSGSVLANLLGASIGRKNTKIPCIVLRRGRSTYGHSTFVGVARLFRTIRSRQTALESLSQEIYMYGNLFIFFEVVLYRIVFTVMHAINQKKANKNKIFSVVFHRSWCLLKLVRMLKTNP